MKLQRCHCPAHRLQPSPASHLPLPQLRGRGTDPRDGTFGPHFQFTKKPQTTNPTIQHTHIAKALLAVKEKRTLANPWVQA